MSNIYLDLNVNTVFDMNPIVTFKSPFSDYYPGCSEKIIGINSKLMPIFPFFNQSKAKRMRHIFLLHMLNTME